MSELRSTSIVEAYIPQQPVATLSEVLSLTSGIAGNNARLMAQNAANRQNIRAESKRFSHDSKRMMDSDLDLLIRNAASAKDAVGRLSKLEGFEVPLPQVPMFRSRIAAMVAANDRTGVASLVKGMRSDAQDRLRADLVRIAAVSCRELGFQVLAMHSGILKVATGNGRETVTMEAAKDKTGGVLLHSDTDGFHGSRCTDILNLIHTRMEAKGVQMRVHSRRSKDSSPAYDGEAIGMSRTNHRISH